MTPPQPTWRKPAGMFLILAAIALWALACVTLIGRLGPLPRLAEPAVYLVAGIVWIWVFPMRRLLRWMELG